VLSHALLATLSRYRMVTFENDKIADGKGTDNAINSYELLVLDA